MKLNLRKHDIDVVEPQRLVSGSVNIVRCRFSFDETWSGYGKTAVFATFGGVWAVPLVADEAIIPWEALEAGRRLRIGVYGLKDDKRLPTVYTEPLLVETGAEEGHEPGEPTQSKWAQLMTAIENGLLRGEPGYTPVKGVDYFTKADKEELAEELAGVAAIPENVLLYIPQDLTEEQKTQSRTNIDAVDMSEVAQAINSAIGGDIEYVSSSFEAFDAVLGFTAADYTTLYDPFFEDMDDVTGG